VTSLFRDNIISEEVYTELVTDIDAQLNNPDSIWPFTGSRREIDETPLVLDDDEMA